MTAVNPAKQIPHLDTWLLRAAFNAQVPSHSGGGWMVYQRQEDGTWQLLQAGGIVFPNQGSSSANAQHVIKNGMEALLQLTTAETTYVRIESLTNPEPRQRSKDNTQATNEPDDYKRLLQQCFSVHCGRPKLQDLKPAVFLAKMRTNTKYDFLKFDLATRTNPLKAYLLRTAQDISTTTQSRQPQGSVQSRLIAYQKKASIG